MNVQDSSDSVPTISVLMPVYNGARFLRKAVESILNQSFGDFELVIVDDGSSDETFRIANSIAERDPRLALVSRPNTGIVGALNDGLEKCRGEFLARMDADDIAEPSRFEEQLNFLREHPEVIAIGTSVTCIDEDDDPVEIRRPPTDHDSIDAIHMSAKGCAIWHPTLMARRESIEAVGNYQQHLQWVEDRDLFLRLAEIGHLANLDRSLLQYRLHTGSVSLNKQKEQRRLVVAATREAYERRGLPVASCPTDSSESDDVGMHTTVQSQQYSCIMNWVNSAIECGFYDSAVKHSKTLVRLMPLQSHSWSSLARSLASRVSKPGSQPAIQSLLDRCQLVFARFTSSVLQSVRSIARPLKR